MPPKTPKLKKKVAEAARAVQKQQARLERERQKHASLHEASARYGAPIIKETTHKGVQTLDGDDESGPGFVTRLRAFLSLRGFKTSGITSAQVHPAPARTHRDRRVLASAAASNPTLAVQKPKLRTTSTPKLNEKSSKPKAKPRPQPVSPTSSSPPLTTWIRTLRRARRPPMFQTVKLLNHNHPEEAVDKLRHQLGLSNRAAQLEDAVYVAIDTEFSPRRVTEIGLSTLDTRDVMDIVPDHRAANWISKVKHQHIIIQSSRRGQGASSSLFCNSQVEMPDNARRIVLEHLQKCRQASNSHARRNVYLVGQSIGGDVAVMKRNSELRLDLSNGPFADFAFDTVFDTQHLAMAARQHGMHLPIMQLGYLARRLGVDSKYHAGTTVRGTHNASNDAAYTMMVMLLIAVRWNDLPQASPLPSRPAVSPPQQPLVTKRSIEKQTRRQRKAQLQQERANLKSDLRRQAKLERAAAFEEGIAAYEQAHSEAGLLAKIGMTAKKFMWGILR